MNNVSSNSSIANKYLDFNSKIMTTYQDELKSSNISSGTANVFNTTTGKNKHSVNSNTNNSSNGGVKLL